MNNKRSMWKLLFASVGVGFLVTNCTIKTASDTGDDSSGSSGAKASSGGSGSDSCAVGHKKSGCLCSDNATGYQVCNSDGVYDACVCPTGTVSVGGASNSGGGTSYSGGSNSAAGAYGEAGSGGEGGALLMIDPADCSGCLVQRCGPEWDACASEDEDHILDPQHPDQYCLGSDKHPGTGQMELILDCITGARAKGIANRVAVRACGASIGMSDDPADNPAFTSWPPPTMSPATEELMNCMADIPTDDMPGDWATDPANFPTNAAPRPWDDNTCAKLACTSKLITP